jgi:hypothetical protein
MQLDVRRAELAALELVRSVLEEASAWLRSRGSGERATAGVLREDAGFTYVGDTAEETWTVSRYEQQVG